MAVNVTQWMACFNMSTMDFSRGRLPIHAARFVSLSDLVWGSNNDLEMVLSAAMATLSFRHFFYGPNKNDRSVKTRSSYRQRPELSAEYWGRRPGFLVIFSFLVFFCSLFFRQSVEIRRWKRISIGIRSCATPNNSTLT